MKTLFNKSYTVEQAYRHMLLLRFSMAIILCLFIFTSTPANADSLRLVSHWAYSKNETIMFLNNGSLVKEYEPQHCPAEQLEDILLSENPSIRLRGERLRDNLNISFYSDTSRKTLTCKFKSINSDQSS